MDDRAYEFDYMRMLEALAVDDDGQTAVRVADELGREHAIACLVVIARHLAADHAAKREVSVDAIFEERRATTAAFHVQQLEAWIRGDVADES